MTLQPVTRWAGQGRDFNAPVAEAIYTTIMKMDADEAVMFSRELADAILQDDLMVHGEAIAKVLLAERAERVQLVKTALAKNAVAKGRAGQNADAELAALEQISKSFIGDLFSHDKRAERARKQQRSVSSGQFVRQTNDIIHTHGPARSDAHEARMGIAATPPDWKLTDPERAAYQQAYHQVSALVAPYKRLPGGTAMLHLIDSNGGAPKIVPIPHGDAAQLNPADFDPRGGRRIVQTKISVIPPSDEKGAYFSLFDALGMPNTGAIVAGSTTNGVLNANRLNVFGEKIRATDPGDEFVPSQKVFRRVIAGSSLISDTLGDVAPPHAKMALKVATHVGTLGPAAQGVIGPTVDRAAYRYRGTERTPAPELLNAIEDDSRTAGRQVSLGDDSAREVSESTLQRERQLQRNAAAHLAQGAAIRRRWDQAAVDHKQGLLTRGQLKVQTKRAQSELAAADAERAKADKQVNAAHDAVLARQGRRADQAARNRTKLASSIVAGGYVGDDQRWKSGRTLAYFKTLVPSAELNDLHLQAGTLPPSEGVILDSNGKVASQAVGYGEDHYLPFTLRGLRKLRGGSYIRTRSWGGPTSEDIRTALKGGARNLTVVSNNGVFTVDFDPSFKGGRRHNDKAHRMIGRYEHLLDAVKNESVSRAQIDPDRLADMEERAAKRFNPAFNKAGYDAELLKLKIAERKNPTLSNAQQDIVAQEYMRGLAEEHGAGTVDALVSAEANRRASKIVRDYKVQYDKYLAANPGLRDRVPVPQSLEVVRQQEMDKLTDPNPQAQARKLATAFGAENGLALFKEKATQANRDNIRRLRLDGPGYEAALNALHEQFPYYITGTAFHRWDNQIQQVDSGYIRPGKLRPGKAQAGLFGGDGKVKADTIRGQAPTTSRVTPEGAAPEVTAAAAAAPAAGAEESAAKLQERVNRTMIRTLLAQEKFGPNSKIAAGHYIQATAALGGQFPDVLKPFYPMGGPASEADLMDQLERDPAGMRAKLVNAVGWFRTNNAFPVDDPEHAAALRDFENGGRTSAAVSEETETGRVLARPDREYKFAHEQGTEYVPGSGADVEAIKAAYLTDPLAGAHVATGALPPTLDDPEFATKAAALTKQLVTEDDALQRWRATGKNIGDPPIDEGEHDQRVRGLVQAITLQRRYADAARVQNDATVAAAARAQSEAAEAEAQAGGPSTIDLSLWGPEQFAALANDPEQAAKVAEGMKALGIDPALVGRARELRDQQEVEDAAILRAKNRQAGLTP